MFELPFNVTFSITFFVINYGIFQTDRRVLAYSKFTDALRWQYYDYNCNTEMINEVCCTEDFTRL